MVIDVGVVRMDVNELRYRISTLPPIIATDTWSKHRQDLRLKIVDDNPAEFLKWPTIVSTMFVGNAPYIDIEYDQLRHGIFDEAIKEPNFGKPVLYQGWTSGNLIHQAYHLSQWEAATGWRISNIDSIVEIGGGYGAMALVCRKLGFTGSYIIYDLPEFSLLQEYYLSNTIGVNNIEFANYPGKLNRVSADLLVAAYSIGEMDIKARTDVLNRGDICSYLFVYSDSFNGIDNNEWFGQFIESKPEILWKFFDVRHYSGSHYLIGRLT